MNETVEIFCYYAREDHSLLLKLKTHLAFLERESMLHIWHDRDISPGAERAEEINKHLNTAHIILLLIIPDFMASEYCTSYEMKWVLAQHERGEVHVIPVLLRPSIWQEAPFSKLQVLPDDARPVTKWGNRDEAWSSIAQGIEQVAKEWRTSPPTISSEPPHSTINATRLRPERETGSIQRDWGEAPDVPVCFGRTKELTLLEQWLTRDRCRLVAIVGMSGDQTVRLWEVSSGQCFNTLQGHTRSVRSVAFSPDGKILASGSGDQTVRLWEVSSGQCFNTLQGHIGRLQSVAFSPDGKTLASSGYDGIINLWDSQTGTCLCTLRSDRPYERMNITQVKGLTESQRATLRSLGAIEEKE